MARNTSSKATTIRTPTQWFSVGACDELPSLSVLEDRYRQLVRGGQLRAFCSAPVALFDDALWTVDATWCTADGATVRARVCGTETDDAQPAEIAIAAEADRPWDYRRWPSPSSLLLPPGQPWRLASGVEYAGANALDGVNTAGLGRAIRDITPRLPWATVVLTHDPRPFVDSRLYRPHPPLVKRLPCLAGRIVEVRLHGAAGQAADRVLRRIGLSLPYAGAVIVMNAARRRELGLSPNDLQLLASPGVLEAGPITALAEKLLTTVAAPWPAPPEVAAALAGLSRVWAIDHVRPALPADTDPQTAVIRDLEQRLASAEKTAQENTAETQEARALLLEARIEAGQLREAHLPLQQQIASLTSQLAAAYGDLDAAEAAVDDQRRRLAQITSAQPARPSAGTDRPAADTPDDAAVPACWEDLLTAAGELPHLSADVAALAQTTQELQGDLVPTWLRRAWEALRALSAYASYRHEHGQQAVPHFRAYLADPAAPLVIPQHRYAPAESGTVRSTPRYRAARTFPVPRHITPTGQLFVETHIRIGSGTPPAPRLYFHDDTAGPTGHIIIVYLGKHLNTPRTN